MKSLAKPLQEKTVKDIFKECVNDYSKKKFENRCHEIS